MKNKPENKDFKIKKENNPKNIFNLFILLVKRIDGFIQCIKRVYTAEHSEPYFEDRSRVQGEV